MNITFVGLCTSILLLRASDDNDITRYGEIKREIGLIKPAIKSATTMANSLYKQCIAFNVKIKRALESLKKCKVSNPITVREYEAIQTHMFTIYISKAKFVALLFDFYIHYVDFVIQSKNFRNILFGDKTWKSKYYVSLEPRWIQEHKIISDKKDLLTTVAPITMREYSNMLSAIARLHVLCMKMRKDYIDGDMINKAQIKKCYEVLNKSDSLVPEEQERIKALIEILKNDIDSSKNGKVNLGNENNSLENLAQAAVNLYEMAESLISTVKMLVKNHATNDEITVTYIATPLEKFRETYADALANGLRDIKEKEEIWKREKKQLKSVAFVHQ